MKQNIIRRALMALAALLVVGTTHASNMQKTVFTYSTSPELKLTRYEIPTDGATARPCIIFAFGGGFTHGNRDDERYQEYFDFMARLGYVVCSIDYRTALAGFRPTTTGVASFREFGAALVNAVSVATTDFMTATAYVLDHAAEWGVDPAKIVGAGSSAGAITALQTEYLKANGKAALLPAEFNYAALVTFAGAVLSADGEPVGLEKFCPTMLFHGDADSSVPYNKLTLGTMGLYGSEYIATKMKAAGCGGAFWTELGLDHAMSITPMHQNLYDIAGFLDHVLKGAQKQYDWTVVTVPGRGEYNSHFTLVDFIKSNMK